MATKKQDRNGLMRVTNRTARARPDRADCAPGGACRAMTQPARSMPAALSFDTANEGGKMNMAATALGVPQERRSVLRGSAARWPSISRSRPAAARQR